MKDLNRSKVVLTEKNMTMIDKLDCVTLLTMKSVS